MKLIEDLVDGVFEFLGFVRKSRYFDYYILTAQREAYYAVLRGIQRGNAWYEYEDAHDSYDVYVAACDNKGECRSYIVKRFSYTKSTRDDARQRAAALCDHLNEDLKA